jgi:hypothetical protein
VSSFGLACPLSWEASGMLAMPGLLSAVAVEQLRALLDALARAGVPTSQQVLYTHATPPESRPPFGALMTQWLNPHLHPLGVACREVGAQVGRDLAARIEGPLFLFQDVLMEKHREHSMFPWHQDEPYWPVTTPGGAIVWCALDPVGPDNGGLEVAIGSHLSGLGPPVDLHTGEPQAGAVAPLADLTGLEVWGPALSPGDALVFHPRTWHRSGLNLTGARRRVWSSSWLPNAARWCIEKAPRHPLSRHVPDGERVIRFQGGTRS